MWIRKPALSGFRAAPSRDRGGGPRPGQPSVTSGQATDRLWAMSPGI